MVTAMSLFDAAFPATADAHREALRNLRTVAEEPVYYSFSFPVARWLARRCPGELAIDWDDFDDTTRLDELLARVMHPAEDDYFDSGWASTRDWLDEARGATPDFDWLMDQLGDRKLQPFWSQLYDAAEIPLAWDLAGSRYSKARNRLRPSSTAIRDDGMRPRPRSPKQAIMEPLEGIRLLPRRQGRRMIDVAMASLAVRYRETYHFNYANPDEVYLADVGCGISVAVFGLLPGHRFPLECTMGYLLLANGVPIGYGGASALFRQVNTGINIFDEFRRSEAAYLWTQVMRVYHALTGCTRFIANAYQFGGDNAEALKSGAFWFYYRLGYRPVAADVRELARSESAHIRRDRTYRSSVQVLRRLASCDMHLALPGARAGEFFDERWFDMVSLLATRSLAAAGPASRRESSGLAPIIAAVAADNWSPAEKRLTRQLLRAKAGRHELPYAKLLARHHKLLISLKNACRRAEKE
ncbi:MAG: hypothetical protein QNJ23_02690 [Woeseiaceae bacterium]|nr:hypothetical protein [Woeseiaceae bacterium]